MHAANQLGGVTLVEPLDIVENGALYGSSIAGALGLYRSRETNEEKENEQDGQS